jgi:5-(carboxyamino)imidazole ribonucleotide mutase
MSLSVSGVRIGKRAERRSAPKADARRLGAGLGRASALRPGRPSDNRSGSRLQPFLCRQGRVSKTLKPVAIIMGSQSDWATMRRAAETLDELGVGYEARIVSAHRTPDRMAAFAKGAKAAGFKIVIAGAGGAAHLPGMTAAFTPLPVFGVPIESKALSGQDSLLSIVQMPAGVPVGTLAIGQAGAVNAALLAAAVLALADPALAGRLDAWRAARSAAVAEFPNDSEAG